MKKVGAVEKGLLTDCGVSLMSRASQRIRFKSNLLL